MEWEYWGVGGGGGGVQIGGGKVAPEPPEPPQLIFTHQTGLSATCFNVCSPPPTHPSPPPPQKADYKYEALGMLSHANHLEDTYGAGPHTISVPRMRPADGSEMSIKPPHEVRGAALGPWVGAFGCAVWAVL